MYHSSCIDEIDRFLNCSTVDSSSTYVRSLQKAFSKFNVNFDMYRVPVDKNGKPISSPEEEINMYKVNIVLEDPALNSGSSWFSYTPVNGFLPVEEWTKRKLHKFILMINNDLHKAYSTTVKQNEALYMDLIKTLKAKLDVLKILNTIDYSLIPVKYLN